MKVGELLSDPSRWTQCATGRNAAGIPLIQLMTPGHGQFPMRPLAESPDAVCWCLRGAILKCYPDDREACAVMIRADEAARAEGYGSAMNLNDHGSYEQVITLVRDLGI